MSYSIIIPVYNSETSLRILYQELSSILKEKDEIIFIDDGSLDKSLTILKEIVEEDLRVKVIHLEKNQGQQYALYLGIKAASQSHIVTMDDDLQHPVHLIFEMKVKIDEGYDLVYSVPVHQHKGYRHIGSKLTGLFFKLHYRNLKGLKVSSFRMFSSNLGQKIQAEYDFVYISAMLLPYARNVANIPYESIKRPYGQSGYSIKKLVMLFMKLYFYYGLKGMNFLKKKENYRGTYEEYINTRCGTLSD
ncbi:MAG: glycosyltransferase [Clostridia bacterium]|nr:glycosyltransferase [Clostridia bacterium]